MGDNLNGIFANMIQGMGFIGCAPNRVYNMAPPDGGGVEATAEGTELTLHSAAAPLTALTLYGKSEQETTTGAQLANFPDVQEVETNGVIWSCENGVIHAAGTVADDKYSVFNSGAYIFPVVAGTYYISDSFSGVEVYVSVRKNETVQYYKNSSFTLDGTETECKVYAQVSPGKTVDETVYPMLNFGNTALPWEPYTGGQPSPSPDYPQEIKSVGDGGTVNITLSDGGSQSQILPVQTPNGLPGIPVDSGGNYTDADGQQWVCDEVDFERGVYVQRIGRKTISSADSFGNSGMSNESVNYYYINERPAFPGVTGVKSTLMSNYFIAGRSNIFEETGYVFQSGTDSKNIYFSVPADTFPDAELFKNWAIENGLMVMYRLAAPTETPLSPSDLAAYYALRTYSPTTVVQNDAGAWMKVGYKATPQPMTMLARKR